MWKIRTVLWASLMAISTGYATSASATCPAFPYTLTNGQTADADQVMSNLNSLHTCVDGNGTVNSGTAGQIGTYSSTGTAISGTTPSAVLDSAFGSTQGSILYRNSTGWTALTPGTQGQFLSTGGSGANPSWVTGGLISPYYALLHTPSVSAFTQNTGTGVTATLGNLPSGRGATLDILGIGSASTSSMEQTVLSQTSFTVTTCIFLASSLPNTWFAGIGVTDSGGKYDAFGWRNSSGLGTFNEYEFATISSSATAVPIFGAFNPNGPLWLRLQLTGGNFVFSASFDGESWETLMTVSATHYLGSAPTKVGVIVDNNSSHHMIADVLSWAQTTP